MELTYLALLLIALLSVIQVQANEIKTPEAHQEDFEALGLHYGKYLKEVVEALDKDQKFSETIKNMDANDIKSGKVAEQLKHVHEDVRKKLNDLKYLEIKRLRDLATRKNEMETLGETFHGSDKRKWRTVHAGMKLPEHLGSDATHFDMDDLHKLMVAATNDLEKIDQERKADFKKYELEKEWNFQERLKMMNETEKQEAIKQRQKLKEKHNEHSKVHEPGSRSQFEEVWEKKDNLSRNEFDPKTFFVLHDTNSDNHWDPDEVKKLLSNEINKLYDPNNPEDDPNEMEEEYERMREHVYKEIDLDRDGLISKNEFIEYSKKPEFKADHGWDDVNSRENFSKQDYEDYVKNREKYQRETRGYYNPAHYQNQPENFHLPNYGWGLPAGADPSQFYGYHVDPNHPQAQQILAQQHAAYQQQAAYHQAAYQQPGVVHQAPYQQQQHPAAAQPYYQGAPQHPGIQGSVPQIQQQQPAAGQINYQQPAAQINQQQTQQNFQQPPPVQQQQQPQQQAQYQQQVPQQQQPQQQQQQQQQAPQAPYQQQVPQQQAPAPNYQQPPVQQAQQPSQQQQNYQPVK